MSYMCAGLSGGVSASSFRLVLASMSWCVVCVEALFAGQVLQVREDVLDLH